MRRFLSIAAVLIVIGALAAWLWPAEAPPPAPARLPVATPPPAAPPTPQASAPAEKKTIRVAFINHLGDADLQFTVNGIYICTAHAGHSCYGDIPFGKHVVEAVENKKVVRTLDLTLNQNTANPKVVVCFPTSPNC